MAGDKKVSQLPALTTPASTAVVPVYDVATGDPLNKVTIANLVANSNPASLTISGLTAGRVTYAGTAGLLSDDSGFTYNSGTHALTATTFVGALTGTVGATTPTTGAFTTLTMSGSLSGMTQVIPTATGLIQFSGRASIQSSADGVLKLGDSTDTTFGRLQFGGTTSSFPAIKRSSTTLAVRLADDSADAPFSASNGTLSGTLTYGGVTLTNAVTGTGKMVLDTSPTIATPVINSAAHVGGAWVADATWTLPAHTLGGTVSGGGNQLNNVIIGTSTPLAGAFTTGSFSQQVTLTNDGTQGFQIQPQTATNGAFGTFANTGGTAYLGTNNSAGTANATGAAYAFVIRPASGKAIEFHKGDDTATPMTIANGGGITLSTNITTATGTPGSLCYNTSTFEMTKNNALTCTVSASEFKTGIVPLTEGLDVLLKMNPAQFAYKDDPKRFRWGFVADDLQAVNSKLADGYDIEGQAKSIDHAAIMAINTKALQELNDKVEILEKRILVLSGNRTAH